MYFLYIPYKEVRGSDNKCGEWKNKLFSNFFTDRRDVEGILKQKKRLIVDIES